MTSSTDSDERRVLVIAHIGRADAREVAREFCRGLTKHGLATRVLAEEATELGLSDPEVEVVAADANPAGNCEVVVVIGGDGTILRAAELARECGTPLLGINLGHIGFLAEAESDDVDFSIEAIVQRRYTAEERLTIDVDVYQDVDPHASSDAGPELGKELVASTWALNEASIEKAARERMLEVVVEIDGRPFRDGEATGWSARPRPARPPTTSVPAVPSCGRASRRCCSSRSVRTRCSRGRWWWLRPRCWPWR